jgi:hypothetical protein
VGALGLARGEASTVEALAEAAFGEKTLLELARLLVQEIVGLVDEADEGVGGDVGGAALDVGPIGRIGPIGEPGESANRDGLWVIFGP